MLKNLKKVATIVLSFAMAVQFGLADSYYVNAVEEPVEPQQQEETTTTAPQEQEQVPTTEEETPQQQEEYAPAAEETNEQSAPETKSVELSYVAEDGTVLHETASRDFNLDYSLKTDSSVMLNFDGYTLKDVIINNSQTVPADQANLSVTSDLVSVKFVYVSVNIKEDKQTSENNEQTKTEGANEDDAEADPETKEELPEYPAFDQSETAGNVVVHATAAEGVLPRDSKLVVKRITRKAILNAVEDTVSEKNKEMDSAVALDITIQNKDGVEIQPNGSVNISFENAAVSGDEINIYHVTDDASSVTEVATNTQSFDANHFSIYVITGVNDVKLTTFNFVDANGQIVSTQIVKTGDELITPTAPDVAGKAFVEWQENGTKFDGFGVQNITKTETRTITAKYEDALYVYFLKPDGSQIMRTEKVGDHEEHDFTTVSYDVDSTHKLVGWAANQNGTDDIAKNIAVPEGSTSVNVYAIIEEGHWVTFDSDGGSAIDSQFVFDKISLNDQTTPTKPGYTFDGWYDGSKPVADGATISSPMTLTAHWTPEQVNYTVIHWWENADDDEYSFHESEKLKGLTGDTTTAAAKSYTIKGKNIYGEDTSDKVFTATTIEQKKIKGDGSTIVNVYYRRKMYTMHFKRRQSSNTDLQTITKKWGQSISKAEWPTYNGNGNWQIRAKSFYESSQYLAYTSTMPMKDSILWSTSGDYTYNAYYYVQKVDGNGYDLHHTDTIKMDSNPKIGDEDCYAIAGFTYSHGDPGVGGYYKNAKFYYTRNSYDLNFINNGEHEKTVSKKYEQSISSENYTPTRPSSLPDYYEFDGWYDNQLCEGEKYVFNGKTMPAQNVILYAKWTAKEIKLTYNLNNPEGDVVMGSKNVEAGTIANTVLPSASAIEGYSFAGWYVADENGHMTTKVFNANDAILKDTNVIGKWLYNGKLTVKYVADGVEAPKDNKIYAGGAKATVANGVTKEGKKFLGWQLVDGNVYQPGQNFEVNKELAVDKNVIILTAVFGDSETSAILNYHPGNGDGKDQSVANLNNVEVTLKNTSDLSYTAPGKDYYFAGWATSMGDAEKGNAKYAVGEKVRVNADSRNDLYATWVKKTVIEVTAKSNTVTYSGEAQSVEGFGDVADGYTISGLTAKATGTDSGEYTTKIEGTAKVTKEGKDVTEKVVVNVVPGKLTISRRNVTLTSASDEKVYDGNALTNDTVTADGFVEGQGATYNVTGTITNVGEKANAFEYSLNKGTKADNYNITKTEGTLKVTPFTDKVTVTITGEKDTAVYDGKTHSVEGYKVTNISNALYKKADVQFNGTAKAEGIEVGTYTMKLTPAQFENKSRNFANVEFVVNDGKLEITPKSITPDGPNTPEEKKTGITVSEPSDSKYDGKEHKEVLTVTDTKTGKELVAGTDYSVTYSSDLVNAGTVKVTVAGLGNYSGSFTKTYKITKRSVTLTSATVSKVYDGSALTNTSITVSGDGFVEGEGASYEVTGTQTEVGNSANAFEYKLNEKTLASNYNITKVVGTLTITAAPAPVTPATPSTPSSTTSTTPRTPGAPQVTTPVETVEKETTPKAEPKEEKVEEEYTPKASPQYYWALINLICAILTVLFGLLLLISKRHKDEDDDEEDDETKQQTTNDDEEKEQEKKRGLFTRVLAVLIAIVSVVFFLVTEDLSLPWTWTDQWTIWMVVIGLVQIVVFFVGRKWKNVDNDDEDEEAQQA